MASVDLAFSLLEEAKAQLNNQITDELLQSLKLLFGTPLIDALDLLERPKIRKYETVDKKNHFYTISKGYEQHIVFEGINYCTCSAFKEQVLDCQRAITCKHILAVFFCIITNDFRHDKLTQDQFNEYLQHELNNLKNDEYFGDQTTSL